MFGHVCGIRFQAWSQKVLTMKPAEGVDVLVSNHGQTFVDTALDPFL